LTMQVRVQIVSIIFAAVVLGVVFELVRRRYLRERYALLWLGAAFVLLVLAVWKDLLTHISTAAGIKTPSNAFFVISFGFLLLLLLHFCAVVSRLSDETRVLAQRVALLEQRQDSADVAQAEPSGDSAARSKAEWLAAHEAEAEPSQAGYKH
jgi:hypothetical protein